jgi:hypothetical protein
MVVNGEEVYFVRTNQLGMQATELINQLLPYLSSNPMETKSSSTLLPPHHPPSLAHGSSRSSNLSLSRLLGRSRLMAKRKEVLLLRTLMPLRLIRTRTIQPPLQVLKRPGVRNPKEALSRPPRSAGKGERLSRSGKGNGDLVCIPLYRPACHRAHIDGKDSYTVQTS